MTVLLTILKILGIVLLAVLGLVLLIVVLVLCVPIRYNVKARYQDAFKAKAGVHWLLRFIHVKLEAINAQIRVRICAFGHCFKKLYIGSWGEESAEESAAETPEAKKPGAKESAAAEESRKKADEKKKKKAEEPEKKKAELSEEKKDPFDAVFESMEEEEEVPEEKGGGAEKIQALIEKVSDFWDDDKNRFTVELILKQLKKLGKHLLPTYFQLEGRLGLGDPAKTGRIVGQVYRFYPLYGEHIRLDGVYDEKVTEGTVEIRGRIRLGILVEIAVRLLLNKNFRKWLRQLSSKDGDETEKNGKEPEEEAPAGENRPAAMA